MAETRISRCRMDSCKTFGIKETRRKAHSTNSTVTITIYICVTLSSVARRQNKVFGFVWIEREEKCERKLGLICLERLSGWKWDGVKRKVVVEKGTVLLSTRKQEKGLYSCM